MEQLKILHCADIHIGAEFRYLESKASKRRAETLLTFERIVDTAKQNQVDLFVIAGDLFDSNNIDEVLVERCFEALGSLSPINVIISAGNHDPLTTDSPYLTHTLPSNVHVFGEEESVIVLDNINTRVYGRSFVGSYMNGKTNLDIDVLQDGMFNLLVLHGDTGGDINSSYNGISQSFLQNCGMDYVALGHIHAATPLLKGGNTYYAYPGCPEGQGFDETDEKGVYIVNVTKSGCEAQFIPLCYRQHKILEVDISNCVSSLEINQAVLDALKLIPDYAQNLYKIILVGSIPQGLKFSLEEIEERISSEVFFAKLRDKTRISVDLETLSKEKSLKGIFVRKMLEKCQKETDEKVLEELQTALDIGLRAFDSEVKYRDDK